MEKQQIYLDTSVPSAFYDLSKPLRQHITQKWFENEAEKFELFTSNIALREIDKFMNEVKKQKILDLLMKYQVQVFEVDSFITELAERYVDGGAIPKSEIEDSLHIAVASFNGIANLVSWNFKHIVSINPIRKIHKINAQLGFPLIEIGTVELFGGYKYGSL